MNPLKLFIVVLASCMLSSCSSFFSGSKPQPMNAADRAIVKKSFTQLGQVPRVIDVSMEDATKVYVFAFDGTENDRSNFDDRTERQTVVGYLASRLEANGLDVEYIVGPGVENMIDSLVCYSCLTKANEALAALKQKLTDETSKRENIDVKVIILGFSRGAAIGRHFMNLVSQTWPEESQYMVRSYGLLFDTVATSVADKLILGLAPTSDYLVHIISRDERREMFPVLIDNDLAYEAEYQGNLVTTPRLTQLEMPGVHSDIGGSYRSGVGTFYRFIGELALAYYGLMPQPKVEFSDDFFSQGAHDSRGWFSRFTGMQSYIENPNSHRLYIIRDSIPISTSRAKSIVFRNKNNRLEYFGTYFSHSETKTLWFQVKKSGDDLSIISARTTDIVQIKDLAFEVLDREKYITFRYDFELKKQMLPIDSSVWKAIPENKLSTLELVLLSRENDSSLFILVNGVQAKKY